MAAELHRAGQSVFLGRVAGTATYARREDHVAVLGPPRSGKSSAIFAPSIAVHPGPVIVTSTRAAGIHDDLRDVTAHARRAVGAAAGKASVYELYLDEAIPPIGQGVTVPVAWSVTDGCEAWNIAVERARSLAGAAIPMSEENANYWRSVLTTFVAPLLHWAAVHGWSDNDMLEWAVIDYPSQEARKIGEADGLTSESGDGESQATEADPSPPSFRRVRAELASFYADYGMHTSIRWCDDILASTLEVQQNVRHVAITQIFGYLSFDVETELEPISLDTFLTAWSTLYITVRPQRAEQYRTLIAAFIDAVASRWQSKGLTEESGTLLLALDEVANIAPIATLPELIAAGGGSGIQVVVGLQTPGQAKRRWGDEAVGTIVRGPTHTIVFPAVGDRSFLDDTAALFGEADEHIYDVTADTRQAGEVVARDLIRLRQQIEQIREEYKHAPALGEKQIQLQVTEQYAMQARLKIGGQRPNVTAESVLADILNRTMVTERTELRPRLTGAQIYGGVRDNVFVVSRANDSRLPSFSFRVAYGWYKDETWRGVLLDRS